MGRFFFLAMEPRTRDSRLPAVVVGVVVAALAVALYWAGFSGGFFFDDEANVLSPEGVHMKSLTVDSIREAYGSGISGPLGRPVAQLSFALNYFASGPDPFVFKATNLVIHLLVGGLAFLVARRLLASRMVAGLTAALWLLHPIQLTSVLYVVQRMTSLSALFLLAGFLLHMIGRERGGRVGSGLLVLSWGILWPLSCLSKESGVLLPLFVLAWETIVRRPALGRLDGFARMLSLVIGIGVLAGIAYALSPLGQWLWAGYAMRSFTFLERLLTEGRVLWFYLGLIALPRLDTFGLHHDDFPLSTDLLTPWTTLPSWIGLLGLGWLVWHMRQRAPLVSFGIAWFLIGHSMESSVLPLEIAHEHRNYLPSFGIALAGAWMSACITEGGGIKKAFGITLVLGAVAYFPFVTALRAHQFGDEIRRTQIESQHHPLSPRTHYDAGHALVSWLEIDSAESPQYYFARTHFERAGAIEPGFKPSWLGLIHLNCLVGKPPDTGWVDELARRLQETPLSPGDRTLLHGVKEMAVAGTLCLPRRDVERLFAAASANPSASPPVRATLYSWLADYLTLVAGDLAAARIELDKSLEIAPANSSNRLKLAQLAYLQERPAEASDILDSLKDVRLFGSDAETLVVLKACIEAKGDAKCAVQRDRHGP